MGEVKNEIKGNNNIIAGRDVIKADKIVNRFVNKTEVIHNPDEHISPAQAREIQEKVSELATSVEKEKQAKEFQRIYGLLKSKFKVPKYDLIPKEQFDDAMKFLCKFNASTYRKSLRRTDNESWKKKTRSDIRARASKLGMSREEFYEYVERVLELKNPILSITELSDTRLKKLYDKIFNKKK